LIVYSTASGAIDNCAPASELLDLQ
jgi:hypothetical protein